MQHKAEVQNWQEAIAVASQPLLTEGVIEEKYVENMIKSVNENGPYIVLTDYFAMPHAKAGEGVNEVGMSLLKLDNPIDMKGKPVKMFLVLAAVDSTAHLEAMSEISELLMNDDAFDVFMNGDLEQIYHQIETK